MPQQGADHRQAQARADEHAGVGVPKSCIRRPEIPAALQTDAQLFFGSTIWPSPLGNTQRERAPNSAWIWRSNSTAASDSGTRCSFFCFVCALGLRQTPALKVQLIPCHRQHFATPRARQ